MKEKNTIHTTPNGMPPQNAYDDNNIPKVDLPSKDMIPDEVPRKDGPGGDGNSK